MINVSLNVARSQELADQIAAFLAAGGEITELAHGHTGIKEPDPAKPRKAQDAMRAVMTRSVSAERANRKRKTVVLPQESEYVRRVNFNREARKKAEIDGRILFTGQCKKHGLTQFRMKTDRHYCCECMRVLTIKKDLKRKQAREIARKNVEMSA
ncbi:hypothetical protein [Acinetobacter ursingii]|uniref:hypothetical protein n=1 Tax=Acinetobacter ursingii TaxID=108980 RepID=UPI00300AE0C3